MSDTSGALVARFTPPTLIVLGLIFVLLAALAVLGAAPLSANGGFVGNETAQAKFGTLILHAPPYACPHPHSADKPGQGKQPGDRPCGPPSPKPGK